MRILFLTMVVVVFQTQPLTAALVNASTTENPELRIPTESYFRERTAASLLYAHILFMALSWIGALPICVMLHIASSNLRYPLHVAFLGLHGIGLILGLAYKSKTPDRYIGSSHSKLGWVLTVLVFAHFTVGVLRSFTKHRKSDTDHELTPFISSENIERDPDCGHSNQGSLPRNVSPSLSQSECPTEETDSDTLFDVHLHSNLRREHRFEEPISWSRRWSNISESHFFIQLLDFSYDLILRFFPILGFVALCTGIVTMAGIFRDRHIFNGLAHVIKGGVFFWFGIFTLGRWMGCFCSRGWAWNLQSSGHHSVSMETIECSLILLYGITNIFLEHLTAWGKAWSAMDFEHVAVSLLFIGGGLCGLMVESRISRRFAEPDAHYTALRDDDFSKTANIRPRVPINPIPAMIIFLLALILSGHHQMSMEATMMHGQVGNFLTGASAARCITYLLLYISPPMSVYPSRPPSELVCSFCLMCGGTLLMVSNRDTILGMIENDIHAMLVAAVVMGLMAILMAWVLFALCVKEWAAAREERWKKKSFSRG